MPGDSSISQRCTGTLELVVAAEPPGRPRGPEEYLAAQPDREFVAALQAPEEGPNYDPQVPPIDYRSKPG